MLPCSFRAVLALPLALLTINCGGDPAPEVDDPGDDAGPGDDGGTSELQGIDLPAAVSVVTVVDDGTSARLFDTAGFDASSDYHTDLQRAHVYDPSMQPLDTVNMILCVLGQTGAASMVNEGAYIALVNMEECDKSSTQADPNQGGGFALTEWTIDSTRLDAESPMIVKSWFNEPDGPMDQPQTIMVEVVARESVSDTKPFGDFEMNFHGVNGSGELHMKGMLRTVANADGLPQFEFINVMGGSANTAITEWARTEATNVILDDADGSGGAAKTYQAFAMDNGFETHSGQELYAVAFNEDYLLRARDADDDDIADSNACADRRDYNRHAWSYNLYHRDAAAGVTAGQRVDMESGFPFVYDTGSSTVRGYYSYWGLWTDGGHEIPSGATISRYDYDTGLSSDYEVAISGGRLVKQTKNTVALSAVAGDQFQFWGEHPDTQEWSEWLVAVTIESDFAITHRITQGEHGMEHTPLANVAIITPQFEGETLWLWSQTLGGNVVYSHVTAANERVIDFYAQELVSPGDSLLASGSTTLHCNDRCLRGGVSSASDYDDLVYPWGQDYSYTLSVSDGVMSLVDNSSGAAVSFDAIDLTQFGHEWGIDTGPMTTTMGGDDQVTYRWETGPNDWNRYVAVIDGAGAAVELSRPVGFAYIHALANDANGSSEHDGRTFLLEYGGDGNLWGFPYAQDEHGRHYAEFTLADGVEFLGDVDGDGTDENLVVKALDMEYSMVEVAASTCSTAGLSTDALFGDAVLGLPSASDVSGISFGLSDWPTVTDPPAVIEGDVQ